MSHTVIILEKKYDIFLPKGSSKGNYNFSCMEVSGLELEKEHWSFTAQGLLSHGWTVILPSYPQAPEFKISEITTSISVLINHIFEKFPWTTTRDWPLSRRTSGV